MPLSWLVHKAVSVLLSIPFSTHAWYANIVSQFLPVWRITLFIDSMMLLLARERQRSRGKLPVGSAFGTCCM
ncbi:MAG: hypothetical protein OXD33_05545 [Rhodobacteraceae bacterium]|nr:hypothetical protein [Paracoccaceae bacterium]